MRLKYIQYVRLAELKRLDDAKRNHCGNDNNHGSICKTTTLKLVNLGLVEWRDRKVSSTGRVQTAGTAHITDAGRKALSEMKREP